MAPPSGVRVPAGGVAAPDAPARPGLARPRDHGRDRHRLAPLHGRGDLAELRETCLIDPLDEDVDDPAAGQPDGERVVVADPVGLEDGRTGLADLERQLVDGALHAATGHAADDLVPT